MQAVAKPSSSRRKASLSPSSVGPYTPVSQQALALSCSTGSMRSVTENVLTLAFEVRHLSIRQASRTPPETPTEGKETYAKSGPNSSFSMEAEKTSTFVSWRQIIEVRSRVITFLTALRWARLLRPRTFQIRICS